MASLTIPNIFTAGTPALASEVNANFTAVVNWSTGLDQDNMATFTGDLAFTIANGNAIVIQNNGNDESIKITQGALLGAGKASILITDNQTQTASGAAELKMVLAAGATIPAIHVTHGVDTFKLTKTALDIGSAVTTTLGGPLVLNNSSVTGNLSLTGKETINRTSTNQFLELANTTTSKSLTVTPQTASFDLNINDTTSAYNFKIDGVTKAVIDNNGLDGSYLKASSVSMSALNGSIPAANRTYSPYQITSITNTSVTNVSITATLGTTTFTTSANNKVIKIEVVPRNDASAYLGLTSRNANNQNTLYAFLEVNGSMVALFPWRLPSGALTAISFTNPTHTSPFQPQLHAISFCATQGIQTISLKAVVGGFMGDTTWTVSGYQFIIYELG